jgi:hypothetical protein
MKNMPCGPAPGAALLLLLCGCGGDLLVGEKRCYGEGVDCASDAPTLGFPYSQATPGSNFDVGPSRSVAPAWVYEHQGSGWPQLKPAPNGGVWVLYSTGTIDLERLNAEGEPVESHALGRLGFLSVDDELAPVVLSWRDGHIVRTTIDPLGEVFEWRIGHFPTMSALSLMTNGREGRLRLAVFDERRSHVAEYSPLGELLWKQSAVRDARDFPFEDLGPGRTPTASYRMVTLSDGSIAMGVPKNGRRDMQAGIDEPDPMQGITLVEPDGNLRWDTVLGEATFSMLLAAGLDGSVIYASDGFPLGMAIVLLDRDGQAVAIWTGQRFDYYPVTPLAICSDSAGEIYAVAIGGERDAPVPTVCRMSASQADAEVVCLGVEDVFVTQTGEVSQSTIRTLTCPEPGVVVLAVDRTDDASGLVSRLVGVEF